MQLPYGDFFLDARTPENFCLLYADANEQNPICKGVIIPYNKEHIVIDFNKKISIKNPAELIPLCKPHTQNLPPQLILPDKNTYIRKVQSLLAHIKNGNIYEINFCVEFEVKNTSINPFDIFLKLYKKSEAPYSFLVKHGSDYIMCASPERFLKRTGNTLISQPMKGTAPRHSNEQQDATNALALEQSKKERSENIMTVDVARHDLSQIAERGTVSVLELCKVIAYKTVHQMISTVSCQLKQNYNLQQILNATFPMASMTGAPKTRAMQLISEYEDFDRAFYSGSIGFMEENGDFDFNVVIRSIFWNEETQRLSFAVGSAITAMAKPEQEWEECMLKAKAMMEVLELNK